ncbi:MAG: flagellar export protein FliJ [Nitrospirota bacterium]
MSRGLERVEEYTGQMLRQRMQYLGSSYSAYMKEKERLEDLKDQERSNIMTISSMEKKGACAGDLKHLYAHAGYLRERISLQDTLVEKALKDFEEEKEKALEASRENKIIKKAVAVRKMKTRLKAEVREQKETDEAAAGIFRKFKTTVQA